MWPLNLSLLPIDVSKDTVCCFLILFALNITRHISRHWNNFTYRLYDIWKLTNYSLHFTSFHYVVRNCCAPSWRSLLPPQQTDMLPVRQTQTHTATLIMFWTRYSTQLAPATTTTECLTVKPYVSINLLKPTGHVMHQQFNIEQLYVLPTLYLCVLYLSENKQRLVPLTA